MRPESDIIGYADGEPIYADRARDDLQLATRNEREQTAECGRVYFVQALHGGPVKIGFSLNAEGRLRRLQEGTPFELHLLHQFPGSKQDEREMHERFAASKLGGEWFEPTLELAELCGARLDIGEPILWKPLVGGYRASSKEKRARAHRELLKQQRRYWRERQERGLSGAA